MCKTQNIFFLLTLSSAVLQISGYNGRKSPEKFGTKARTIAPKLNMTLCADKCAGENCKTYFTPTEECYSAGQLFPNDPSWSRKDVHDAIIWHNQTLVRTIFESENGSCGGNEDVFQIPLNVCVGPFDKPRPWGSFCVAQQGKNNNITPGSCSCDFDAAKKQS